MALRPAQSLFLPFDDVAAGTSVSLTATVQQACLLNDLVISCALTGLVTAIAVAGQSLMCSDLGVDLGLFRYDCAAEGHRGIGIALAQQQQVTLTVAPASSAVARASIGIDPVDPSAAINVNDLGDGLNYVFGLGSSGSVAVTSSTTVTANSRRDGVLGPLIGSYLAAASHIIQDATITSFKVNNLELMNGVAGSDVPLQAILPDATDLDGRTLAYPIETNDAVAITYRNDDADAGDVFTARAGIFMMPAAAAIAA
jgi:hypothetical protein